MKRKYSLVEGGANSGQFKSPEYLRVSISVACLAAGACPAALRAADWTLAPRVAVSAEYDDNYLLSDVDGQAIKVSGAALEAALKARLETPSTFLQITPRVYATYFPGDTEVNSTDGYLAVETGHRGERLRTELTGSYARVTLVKGYLPTTAVQRDLGSSGSGNLTATLDGQAEEEQFRIGAAADFQISQRWDVGGQVAFLDASYDQPANQGYVDFQDLRASARAGYKFTPTGTASILLTGYQYEPGPDSEPSASSYGVQAEWFNRLSKTSQFYVRAGVATTQFDDVPGASPASSDETTFSGGAGVHWTFEVAEIFLDVASDVAPNWSGGVVQRDELRLSGARRISPQFSVIAGARVIKDDALGGDPNARDEDYAAGSLGMEWRISRALSLTANYDYVRREYSNAADAATSNGVSLAVVYEPQRPDDSSLILPRL